LIRKIVNKAPFWSKTAEHASLSVLFHAKRHFQNLKKAPEKGVVRRQWSTLAKRRDAVLALFWDSLRARLRLA
jgi:hypothetical protein